MGISSSSAPADVAGLYSIDIGHSGAARYGESVSSNYAELVKLVGRYLTIDKILPPWSFDWVPIP